MGYGTGVGLRTAVVTGAASPVGIGHHTAARYAAEGWAVALLDIDEAGVRASAEALRAEFSVPVFAAAIDVADQESVKTAAAAVTRESGLPRSEHSPILPESPLPCRSWTSTWSCGARIIDVNLTGTFLACQAFLPAMIDGGYGRIVNMSSVSAQQGGGVFSKTPYSAAKAGVLGLTRSLAREMAEHNITVNAVAPGVVATDIRAGASDEENERRLSASVPLGRQATPQDVAALVVFLSSEDAGYITGTTQSINGGAYIA